MMKQHRTAQHKYSTAYHNTAPHFNIPTLECPLSACLAARDSRHRQTQTDLELLLYHLSVTLLASAGRKRGPRQMKSLIISPSIIAHDTDGSSPTASTPEHLMQIDTLLSNIDQHIRPGREKTRSGLSNANAASHQRNALDIHRSCFHHHI